MLENSHIHTLSPANARHRVFIHDMRTPEVSELLSCQHTHFNISKKMFIHGIIWRKSVEDAGKINHTIFHQNMHPQVFNFPTSRNLPHFLFVLSLVRWRGTNDQFHHSDPHLDRRRWKSWGTLIIHAQDDRKPLSRFISQIYFGWCRSQTVAYHAQVASEPDECRKLMFHLLCR